MRGEIIVIGNELVTGQVSDLNGCYAARRLTLAGFYVRGITIIGDEASTIESTLRCAIARSDFAIITGGLGSTSDDITTEIIAKTLERPLVQNADILSRLESSLRDRGIAMTPEHQKLALLPQGAEVIDPVHHVCGFFIIHHEKPLFFLPGVPEQMRNMLDSHVIPGLLDKMSHRTYIKERILKVFGLEETKVNQLCQGIGEEQKGVTISFLPRFPETHIIITVRGKEFQQTQDKLRETEEAIRKRLGSYVFGRNGQTLEEVIGHLLRSRRLTLAIAESCTGGLIGHRITDIPGSSDYLDRDVVVYSNRSKEELLKVPKKVLEDYGAVSGECAEWMARNIRISSGADLGLSVTGIAGPTGGTNEKPVGTVFMGMSTSRATVARGFRFQGSRESIKIIASEYALDWVRRYLIDDTLLFSY
ncbi:MAG TPA: competence/damage-inducible protein A [Syntrophaceae bacterium]|nr:competence/damage-inducible protein A [Syntrophaceae bacterium]